MIKKSFDNIKYGSYPQNTDFDDLRIDYKQRLFKYLAIDCLTDNKVERFKVILIKILLDKIIYKSNPQNASFDDLPFDGDESFIGRR